MRRSPPPRAACVRAASGRRAACRGPEEHARDTLAAYALADREAHRPPTTTNSIEHDHAEVRRRTGAIRVLPNEPAFVRPAIALAIERNQQRLGRRYAAATADARGADEHARMAA